jgi:hypothetical protein
VRGRGHRPEDGEPRASSQEAGRRAPWVGGSPGDELHGDERHRRLSSVAASWVRRCSDAGASPRSAPLEEARQTLPAVGGRGEIDGLQGTSREHRIVAPVHDAHGSAADAARDLLPPREVFPRNEDLDCRCFPTIVSDEPRPVWYDRWKPTTRFRRVGPTPRLPAVRCGYELTGAGDLFPLRGRGRRFLTSRSDRRATIQSKAVSGQACPGKEVSSVVQGEERPGDSHQKSGSRWGGRTATSPKDPELSRQHALIPSMDERPARGSGSTNGTFVDGERSRPRAPDRSEFRIGFTVRVRDEGPGCRMKPAIGDERKRLDFVASAVGAAIAVAVFYCFSISPGRLGKPEQAASASGARDAERSGADPSRCWTGPARERRARREIRLRRRLAQAESTQDGIDGLNRRSERPDSGGESEASFASTWWTRYCSTPARRR